MFGGWERGSRTESGNIVFALRNESRHFGGGKEEKLIKLIMGATINYSETSRQIGTGQLGGGHTPTK